MLAFSFIGAGQCLTRNEMFINRSDPLSKLMQCVGIGKELAENYEAEY
jgi:hypothetical protein